MSKDAKPAQNAAHERRGEVIVFPKLDARRLVDGVNHWKRTGKLYKGAPD